MMRRLVACCFLLIVVLGQTAAKENLTVLQLETLRIEGYIYEPQVLFILEKPNIEMITIQEQEQHDFLQELDKPLFDLY